MSITIAPTNNLTYCRVNKLIEIRTEECFCAEDGKAHPTCPYCGGAGSWEEKRYPFEMNLANANFMTFWSALGLSSNDWDEDYCGTVETQKVADALASLDRSLVQRATRHYLPGSEKPADALFQGGYEAYDFGIGAEQAASYCTRLADIVKEALRRGETISWA